MPRSRNTDTGKVDKTSSLCETVFNLSVIDCNALSFTRRYATEECGAAGGKRGGKRNEREERNILGVINATMKNR